MLEFSQRHIAVNLHSIVRDGAIQQNLPFGVRHVHHLAAFIMWQTDACIGVWCAGSGHLYRSRQANILAGSTHADFIAAALNLPSVRHCVPVAEGFIIERNCYALALPRSQFHFFKAFQFLHWAENFGIGLCYINLYDLRTITAAGVCHCQCHTVRGCFQVRVGKAGIA